MSTWQFPSCPQPPDWTMDWPAIESAFTMLPALSNTPQDPVWHAEGDVLTHTRMVADAMIADANWRALNAQDRSTLFVAGVLHDIGKGITTRLEEGRISSPRHSLVGQRLTRRYLWENFEIDFQTREAICSLVRYHGLPIMFLEKPTPERAVIEASQTVRCDHLATLAGADVLGRLCPDANDFLDRIGLFQELCREQRCLTKPKAFESDHHRFVYFNGNGDYNYVPYDDTKCEVTLMSGLPAAGKDYWVSHHAGDMPVISLDDLRNEMGIDPGEAQGSVANAAKEKAREHLRKGQGFVWNATNVSRELRQQLIALFANYKARVRIVCGMWARHLESPQSRPQPPGAGRRDRPDDRQTGGALNRRSTHLAAGSASITLRIVIIRETRATMRELDIPLAPLRDRNIEQWIEGAIASSGLRVSLFATLRKYPGSVHWHPWIGCY